MAISDKIKAVLDWAKDGGLGGAQRKRRRRLALGMILGMLAYTIFGGGQGLVSLALSWRETWSLRREIAALQAGNQELEARQIALRSDRASFEKSAREKLFLKNPGDLIYRFEGKPSGAVN